MVAATLSTPSVSGTDCLRERFLAILPIIRRHAQIYFRNLPCLDTREDRIAETIALAWRWFLRLSEQGKDASQFPMAFAILVALSVRSGRRLAGSERARDAMSPVAQRRGSFGMERLGDCEMLNRAPFQDALADNTQTPPDEQAMFRIDFRAWRSSHGERDRRIIDALMIGERTLDVSRKHGISPARVSQKRRQFRNRWLALNGEQDPPCQRRGAI